MKKGKINLIISLIIGIGILSFIIFYFGTESLELLYNNLQPIYLIPFIFLTFLTYMTNALRLKIVLKAHGKIVNFWSLLKQNIAGFAVSYVTPSVRVGGEPLKLYMMYKENKVGLKTGSSALILDKFLEFLGSALFATAGFVVLFFVPGIPLGLKLFFAFVIFFCSSILFVIWYLTIKEKGSFSKLFNLFRFYKINKLKNFATTIEEIEDKMRIFFVKHKPEFLWGTATYILYGFLTILEFKFLLMALGVNASFIQVIVIVVVWGIVNFLPIPGGLGLHEASQSGLFVFFAGSGGVGLVFSLMMRFLNLIIIGIGFTIISHFGGREIMKKIKSK